MLQFCSVINSLSHTTLSNKVRGIFFLKRLCHSSLLCRRYDSTCRCICICIMCLDSWSWWWLYNKIRFFYFVSFIYYIINILLIWKFFTPALVDSFYWSLNDSKCPQVSRILLSILADVKNAVVWTVSTRPLISKSSGSCTSLLVIVLSAPFTIGITVTFMFHNLFIYLARSRYLSLLTFLQFYPVISWNGKVHYSISFLSFFVVDGRLVWSSGRK